MCKYVCEPILCVCVYVHFCAHIILYCNYMYVCFRTYENMYMRVHVRTIYAHIMSIAHLLYFVLSQPPLPSVQPSLNFKDVVQRMVSVHARTHARTHAHTHTHIHTHTHTQTVRQMKWTGIHTCTCKRMLVHKYAHRKTCYHSNVHRLRNTASSLLRLLVTGEGKARPFTSMGRPQCTSTREWCSSRGGKTGNLFPSTHSTNSLNDIS